MSQRILFTIGTLARGVLGFLSLAFYVRWLPAEQYGVFSLVNTFLLLSDALLFFWIREVYIRYYHREENRAHKVVSLLGQVFFLTCVGGLFIGCIAKYLPFSNGLKQTPLIAAVIVLEGTGALLQTANRVRNQAWNFLIVSFLRPLAALGLGGFLVSQGMGAAGVWWGMIAASALTLLVFLKGESHSVKLLKTPFDKKLFRDLLGFGIPLVFLSAIEYAAQASERAIAARLLGLSLFASYAAAADLVSRVIYLMAFSLHGTLYPGVVKALEKGTAAEANNRLATLASAMAALIFPTSVGIIVLAPAVGAVLLGPNIGATAVPLIPIMVVSSLLRCATGYYIVHGFHLARATRRNLAPAFLFWAVSSGCSYIGISQWGLQGALAGPFLGSIAYFTWGLARVRKLFPLPFPRKELAMITTASILMGMAVYPCRALDPLMSLLIGVPVGVIVYSTGILGFNVLGTRTMLVRRLVKGSSV